MGHRTRSDARISSDAGVKAIIQFSWEEEEGVMSRVRVLVGTKKGAFILDSDGMRKDWKVSGPF